RHLPLPAASGDGRRRAAGREEEFRARARRGLTPDGGARPRPQRRNHEESRPVHSRVRIRRGDPRGAGRRRRPARHPKTSPPDPSESRPRPPDPRGADHRAGRLPALRPAVSGGSRKFRGRLSSRRNGGWCGAFRSALNDKIEISDACDYYREILPFYEKESVARAHLAFWRGVAREHAPRRILEIGAGLGRITAELSRVAPAVGLD